MKDEKLVLPVKVRYYSKKKESKMRKNDKIFLKKRLQINKDIYICLF